MTTEQGKKLENFLVSQTKSNERKLRSLLKPFLKFLREEEVEIDEFDQTEVIRYISEGEYKKYAERVCNGNKEKLSNETLFQTYYGIVELIRFQRDNAENRDEHFRHNQRLARVKKLKRKKFKSLAREIKKSSGERKWLKIKELDELLRYTYKSDKRDFCIFYLLGYFGVRQGELFKEENISKIDWDKNEVVFLSEKSFYERVLYFNDTAKRIFKKALNHDLLRQFPYWRLKEYKRLLPEMNLTPHNFRYTFNHHMKRVINELVLDRTIKEDPDLLLKSLAGHSADQDMSQYYDSSTKSTIKKVMIDNHYFNDLQITSNL